MIRVSRIDVLSGYDTSSMDEMFEVLNALPKREKRRLIQRVKDRKEKDFVDDACKYTSPSKIKF